MIANKIWKWILPKEDEETLYYKQYLREAYPSNHTYTLANGKLKPGQKLKKRYKKIITLYPSPLTSLLDIGCAKGFFIFAASRTGSQRNLGIDVHTDDINVCKWVEKKLEATPVLFEKMELHQLAEQIEHFGGPFQTVLVLNTYQYLYFGSRDYPAHYLNHERIFQLLKKMCGGRIIFNNRLNYSDCQSQIKNMNHASHFCENYTESKIKTAAQKYFELKEEGTLGGYPLWVLKPSVMPAQAGIQKAVLDTGLR